MIVNMYYYVYVYNVQLGILLIMQQAKVNQPNNMNKKF